MRNAGGGRRRRGGGGEAQGGGQKAPPPPPPTILAKPKPVSDDAAQEEWPTIHHPTNSPARATPPPWSSSAEAERAAHKAPSNPSNPQPQPSLVKRSVHKEAETKSSEVGEMSSSCRLITEHMEWTETLAQFLTENSDFRVIAAVGPMGVGKSTLLSMLGGASAKDLYRSYAFRPQSRERAELGRQETSGVDVFVTPTRRILIDTQALFSGSAVEDLIRSDKRYSYEFKSVENFAEMEGLEILAWVLAVSEVVLVVTDTFPDLQLLRSIRTAAMLSPVTSDPSGNPHLRRPHLVLVQTKTRAEEYRVGEVRERSEWLRRFMAGSELNWESGVSLGRGPELAKAWTALGEEAAAVSYFPLPEILPRGQPTPREIAATALPDINTALWDFCLLVRALPPVPLIPPSPLPLTEAAWLKFAGRVWDEMGKSHLVSEFGRLLT